VGILRERNCLIDYNCTISMRGKDSYYYSEVQSIIISVINAQSETASVTLNVEMKPITTNVSFYIGLSFVILIAFAYGFQHSVEWMNAQL